MYIRLIKNFFLILKAYVRALYDWNVKTKNMFKIKLLDYYYRYFN